jgi:hypothetical protein
MAKKKRRGKIAASLAVEPKFDPNALVSAPKLRRILDVSPVTLWRWRHEESMAFPRAMCIQGRLYFPWHQIAAWLERQQQVI